ncbi:retinitis pigmentosa 1-like 1 protein, partial [Elgaria multicarinata webbii]|uniref:retinitis pigmentosa 1-like 1 protein n=1 Tax=Elgaria multicarinata webbii TaxID=159646 RepID=UPI002FCD4179
MTQPAGDYLSTAAPYNYDQPLPPVARTNAVTQVPPAKKITFYKSGDPQFGGVKMAINQRSFKSFNALMDDLSHRVPLPFGVRTITTPRGIHCISTLDQLEDGGCYLCSDKKYVTPISLGTGSRRLGPQKASGPASTLRKATQDVKREDYTTAFTQQSPRIPKKITLVKNGDITTQRPIILNRRNARSFKTLLDEISEIMQFTVKKLYTVDGKRIDSMQALLRCPSVLICVGREPFKPIVTENSRKHSSSEKLPGLPSQSNSNSVGENHEMNFGLKAKKSVIHPRSSLSNRSMRLSLSSEKLYPNGLTTSPENGTPCSNDCPHSKAGKLVRSLVNDDIEKRVHVNKDGSLSVEMKVRFRLLNDETLQWSTQIKKSSLMNKMPVEELGIHEDNGVEPVEEMNPEASSEADDSLYPCDVDSYISNLDESENEDARCHNCGKPCEDYDIWKNPLHASQKEEPGTRHTWYTHSSCSSASSHRRVVRKKVASVDSIRTSSSGEEYSKHVVRESSRYSETVENRIEYRSVKKCCCQHDCTEGNPSQRGSPEEMDAVADLANSQNEDDCMVEGDGDEGQGSRTGSGKSKSSQCSAESQIKVCEEISSVARTISSCSIKEREDIEDVVGGSSSPNSICSQSSKRSRPGAKDNLDEVSENDQVISSFSSDSCLKKDATEEGVEKEEEQEEEDVDGIRSTSEKMGSSPPAEDDGSECGRCSTGRCCQSNAGDGTSRSDEIHVCSAASASPRASRRNKPRPPCLEAGSKVSARSSRGPSIKKKKTKSSLHAEDARSSSRTSYYSRSSHEVEKREAEGHISPDSSAPHSNVSSLSDAAAPPAAANEESTSSTSKCFSKSSEGSQKERQPEDTSKTSSPCSSFSEEAGRNGAGTAPVSSQDHSSRPGSESKSTCSKCGHVAGSGRDGRRSVNSRVSSYSEARSRCAELEGSRRSSDACSQSSVARSSKPRLKRTSDRHAGVERSSQASAADSASMYSLHCPAPPKGRPSGRRSRTVLVKKTSGAASACAESEPTAGEEQEGEADPQSPERDAANGAGNNADPLNEAEEGSCPEKGQGEAEAEAAPEGGEEILPSSLPNASPEEVVHEWLRKIPSETLLMKSEMQDDGEGEEGDAEIPSCSNNQESLGGEPDEKKEDGSAAAAEAAGEGEEEEAAEEEAKEDLDEEKASEAMSEAAGAAQAECKRSAISNQNNHKKDLPNTIQTSVQIMKALLASKQEAKLDRSHSLPEVSPTMGRKLSNSANILITCLASLQLLDEELDPSEKANKCPNRPRYTELLNIFQALWFGCTSEKGGTSSGLQVEVQAKVPSGFKGRNSKDDDFTPMSSSGVDVSSGDGGSGEGSVAGARDCALSPEKTDVSKPTEEEEEEEATEGEEADDEGEREGHSRPPTHCSKSEGGDKADSNGGEEVKEDPGSDYAVQEEVEEDPAVNEADEGPGQEAADEATEEASNNDAEANTNGNEANGEEEPEKSGEKQLVDESEAEMESSHMAPRHDPVKAPAMTQQKSLDPDPVWVLNLLRKIEKEFMTHYVSAMNDFKMKWNLPNSDEVDLMIAELKEEVSKRIQKSIQKELRKIRSRAGKRIPRPPDGEVRRDSALKMENRRRRLQSIHKMSLYNDRTVNQSKQPETRDFSGDEDEDFIFSTIRDDSRQLSEDDYCPCDACIRKKMLEKAAQSTVTVATNAPVVKAFDLQQILRMKDAKGPERNTEHDIAEEGPDEEDEQAEGETAGSEANQETEPVEEQEEKEEDKEEEVDVEEEADKEEEVGEEEEEDKEEEMGEEEEEDKEEEVGEEKEDDKEEEVGEEKEEEKGEEVGEEKEDDKEEKVGEEKEEEKGEEVGEEKEDDKEEEV